ncbi:hypothetical protein SLE2022_234180 [Rubroshorea leprosula]
MEKGCNNRWCFQREEELNKPEAMTIKEVLSMLMENLNKDDLRLVVPLANDDPSRFECFRTTIATKDAIIETL